MDLEQIFSAMSLLAMIGWLCLVLAPLRRPLLVAAARVVAAVLALAYVILIVRGLTAPDGPQGGGFDSLAKVMILLSAPATMLPAWIHFLCFDLWVGTWEVEDAPKAGVPHWLLIPVMFGTFMYGPAGLLAYLVIRTIAGRLKKSA
ncbi:MAG: ABA4-like family protein [Caulobacter sp.]|nr:ABA4-like family protein [Caulobacter sp.]